jgi:hypothetical protein
MRVALTLVITAALALVLFTMNAGTGLTGQIHLTGQITESHNRTRKPGSAETFYISLQSPRRIGRSFGYGIVACIWISTKTTIRQCAGTFSLPRGKISVAGSFLYPPLLEVAITGGTGAYKNAGGVLDVIQYTPLRFHLIFTLN